MSHELASKGAAGGRATGSGEGSADGEGNGDGSASSNQGRGGVAGLDEGDVDNKEEEQDSDS